MFVRRAARRKCEPLRKQEVDGTDASRTNTQHDGVDVSGHPEHIASCAIYLGIIQVAREESTAALAGRARSCQFILEPDRLNLNPGNGPRICISFWSRVFRCPPGVHTIVAIWGCRNLSYLIALEVSPVNVIREIIIDNGTSFTLEEI